MRVRSFVKEYLRARVASIGLGAALAVTAGGAVLSACSGESTPKEGPPLEGTGGSTASGAGTGGGTVGPTCGETPAIGCPCDTEGAAVDCGHVIHREGDFVSCSAGTRTCSGGVWSDCIGEKYGTPFYSPPKGQGTGNFVSPTVCATDPCDPSCQQFDNPPSSIDAGADSGIVNDAGVVTLPGQVGNKTTACTGIQATPTSETVTVTNIPASGAITYTASFSGNFTAQFTPLSCFSGNAPVIWTVDNTTVSTISSAGAFTLVDPFPGVINATGHAGAFSADVAVNVIVNAVDTTSAPSGYSNTSFTGSPTVNDSITMLYPYNNTVLPLGQLSPTIQWDNLGTGANAVRVQLRYPAGTGALFTWSGIVPELQSAPTPTQPAQPRAFIPQKVWVAFENAAKGGNADIVVQRIVGGTLRKPNPPVNLHFATDQLKGTVYYQSYGTNLAHNLGGALVTTGGTKNFGAATLAIKQGASAPVLIAGDDNNCRVCHSVASSGSALVTQSSNNGDADSWYYNLSNLAQTDVGPSSGGAGYYAFAAISPDGTYLFSNSGPLSGAYSTNNSTLYTLPGHAAIGSSGLPAFGGRTPAFSPDANHIAFQWYSGTVGGVGTGDGVSLGEIDFNPASKAFSNFRKLATPGANLGGTGGQTVGGGTIYYPYFLPGSTAVVWNLETVYNGRDPGGTRSQCDATGTCNNEGAHAELWWTDVATKKSARLDNANGKGYLPLHSTYSGEVSSGGFSSADPTFNYEPTVLPQVSGGYAWMVFTSRRRYGNIATINPFWSDPRFQYIDQKPTTKKLWVAAINPNAAPGTDASYPAFYIEGQELLAGNARGYWVLDPCKPAGPPTAANLCTDTLDCCPATGSNPPVTCSLDAPPAQTKHCISQSTSGCVADGSSCTADIDCCGYPNSLCAQGTCKVPVLPLTYNQSSFTSDYAAPACGPGQTAVWVDIGMKAKFPTSGGTYPAIKVYAQTGTSASALQPATPVLVATMQGPPVDQSTAWTNYSLLAPFNMVGTNLTFEPFLRLTFELDPTADSLAPPSLVEWRARFDCKDNQ